MTEINGPDELNLLLSFQADGTEDPGIDEDTGITVIDNFEDGPKAINYQSDDISEEEITAAEILARKVFEDLGLPYPEEGNNG